MELRSGSVVIDSTRPIEPSAITASTSFALHFTGYLYAVGLRDALADLIARHEPLRTVYPTHRGGRGLVLPVDSAPVPPLVPIQIGCGPADVATAVADFVDDVGEDPRAPVHARSFRIDTDPDDPPQHVLALVLGRRTADKVSPARLARDLMTAYGARRRNLPPQWDIRLPPGHLHVHELRQVRIHEPAAAAVLSIY